MNKPLIMLAPLAGYTNVAYRTFMKQFGVDIVVSEMISDYALIYQNKETEKMIETSPKEGTVAIQLFGGNLESMLLGLKELEKKTTYDYLDINLGCPVQKVIKSNAGSAWLKKERNEELYNMVSKLVKASSKPVTCKVRLGWDDNSINIVETCKTLEKAGCSLITVHGRTRSQMYSGIPNYDLIKLAKESVKIPVIANGDINTLEKAIEVLEYTKCDGIALGRGCLGNPSLIKQIRAYLDNGEKIPLCGIEEQINYLQEHFNALKNLKGEYVALQEMRGIGSWYLKGFTHVKEYKIAMSKVSSLLEFEEILTKVKANPLITRVEV